MRHLLVVAALCALPFVAAAQVPIVTSTSLLEWDIDDPAVDVVGAQAFLTRAYFDAGAAVAILLKVSCAAPAPPVASTGAVATCIAAMPQHGVLGNQHTVYITVEDSRGESLASNLVTYTLGTAPPPPPPPPPATIPYTPKTLRIR
jgi:hypothetical protein